MDPLSWNRAHWSPHLRRTVEAGHHRAPGHLAARLVEHGLIADVDAAEGAGDAWSPGTCPEPRLTVIARERRAEARPTPPWPAAVATQHEHGLAKAVWTEADFADMGWHDSTMWSLTVQKPEESYAEDVEWLMNRLVIDLDYITRWVEPARRRWRDPRRGLFDFWVAPATLVFHRVTDLDIDMNTAGGTGWLDISDIDRTTDGWHIAGHDFEVTFRADGFRQTFRRLPVLSQSQRLSLAQRGGCSTSEVAVQM